ncbi:MAG: type II toxin-antitoxin system prevent-host-death family antitoxin [Pseudomonadota bacterium]
MDGASNSADQKTPLQGPVSVSELRANLADYLDRVEDGEEVVIARGREPVAKLTPVVGAERRRLGTLKAMLSEAELDALAVALDTDLSADEQRILEGEGTDEAGIWRGLPKAGRDRK